MLAGLEDAQVQPHAGREDHEDGHGLPQGAPEPQHGGGDDAGAAEGQDGLADHLVAGGAQGQGGLLLEGGRLEEDLADGGGDDRQDHDGQDQGGGGDVLGRGRVVGEQRDEAEVLAQPGVDGVEQGHQPQEAPQAEDHRGDRGQQVHHVAQGLGQAARGEVGDEQGHPDAQRHRDAQGDGRGQQRAEDERGHVAPQAAVAHEGDRLQGLARGRQGGQRLPDEEGGHEGEHHHDEGAGAEGQAGEDPVAGLPGGLAGLDDGVVGAAGGGRGARWGRRRRRCGGAGHG